MDKEFALKEALERLDKKFPNAEFLSRSQVASFFGLSYNTIVKMFGKNGGKKLSKIDIATKMIGGDNDD